MMPQSSASVMFCIVEMVIDIRIYKALEVLQRFQKCPFQIVELRPFIIYVAPTPQTRIGYLHQH